MIRELTEREYTILQALRGLHFGTVSNFCAMRVECESEKQSRRLDLKQPEDKFLQWIRKNPTAEVISMVVQDGIVQYLTMKSTFPGALESQVRVKIT